jgi:hypothetical protein
MAIENWRKTINGYFVSDLGRIKSPKGKLLRLRKTTLGYCQIRINKKEYLIHRLVAMAFISNPKNKPEVNHIDTDPANNIIDNLQWVTHQENCSHSIPINRKKRKYLGK